VIEKAVERIIGSNVIEPYSNRTYNKVKVKVTLVQTLRLCTGRTAHRGIRGITLLFHDQRN